MMFPSSHSCRESSWTPSESALTETASENCWLRARDSRPRTAPSAPDEASNRRCSSHRKLESCLGRSPLPPDDREPRPPYLPSPRPPSVDPDHAQGATTLSSTRGSPHEPRVPNRDLRRDSSRLPLSVVAFSCSCEPEVRWSPWVEKPRKAHLLPVIGRLDNKAATPGPGQESGEEGVRSPIDDLVVEKQPAYGTPAGSCQSTYAEGAVCVWVLRGLSNPCYALEVQRGERDEQRTGGT
jgi:hypothetical protein